MTLFGSHKLSRTFRGKQDVLANLVPLFRDTLAGPVALEIRTVIAEGEVVAIEMEGKATAKDGRRYDNRYLFLVRVANGKIVETREYMDTELVKAVFG